MPHNKKSKRGARYSGGSTPEKETKQAKILKYITSTSETDITDMDSEVDNTITCASGSITSDCALVAETYSSPPTLPSSSTSPPSQPTATMATGSVKEEALQKHLMSEILQKLSRLDNFHKEIMELKTVVQDLKDTIEYNEKQISGDDCKIKALQNQNEALRMQVSLLNHQNSQLHDRIVEQEDYSRRENLVISGIQESKGENCFIVAQRFFEHMGFDHIFIQRCHRVGVMRNQGPRDLLVRLLHFPDKMMIMNNRKKLPNGIYINDDHAPETKRKINTLRPVFKEAKKIDPSTTMSKDKLFFKTKQFSVKNIHSININTENLSEKYTKDVIAFAGRYSRLSNLNPCPVQIEGTVYSSSEHFYQYQKCLANGNIKAAAAVLLASEPEDAMAAGSAVKPPPEWTFKEGAKIMEKVLRVKFSSKPMRDKLLSTETRQIVEATRNPIWGIGQPFTSPNILQPGTHNGKNLLGQILMKLRGELTQQKPEHDDTPL